MANIILMPGGLDGRVTPPPSKSAAHRAIICASLSSGKSILKPFFLCDDMSATIRAMRALGAEIQVQNRELSVDGSSTFERKDTTVDCGESGSTLRFTIPVAAAGGGSFTFIGKGRLPSRPLGPYLDALPRAGVGLETHGGLPLRIKGRLQPGRFELPGNVSSQFVTGLLLGLPLLDADSEIILSSPLESAGYVNLTIDVMRRFGVQVNTVETGYIVKGNQLYTPCNFLVEGDWSQAAFWLAAGALGSRITCEGMNLNSLQGDRRIAGLLRQFGARLTQDESEISISADRLQGIDIDASQIPDLVPVLAVVAALSRGITRIRNAGRLRMKESDRLSATTKMLNTLGAKVTEQEDGLMIEGVEELSGGTVDGCNDHRIVMAAAVASVKCSNPVIIIGSDCVNKSYPDFFEQYNRLGGNANVIHLG
ncbi:MAG TPA: 3-phosphoshikimate 1-carboxyvinyltransferase [Clostridia bacterium]|nr:3-phosphoshikimate 1-carboxyvinyltransferase [Clostridia bacterium]